jgi:hypothetical protein
VGNASRFAHDEINEYQSTLNTPPRELGDRSSRVSFAQTLELARWQAPETIPVYEDDACSDAHLG